MNRRDALERFATQIRIETLKQIGHLGFGHIGGCMSLAETLAVLYSGVLTIDPKKPNWDERDWLVVSKGHAGPAVYSTLALKGFFDIELLKTLNMGGTSLPSHCDRNKTPGIDMTTGSLGQGISVAIGVALGRKLQGKNNRVYLIMGDGECQEGQVWEGAMCAAHFKVDNLIAFVDNNKQQIDDYVKKVMDLDSYHAKFAEFGWHTQTVNGHDVEAIEKAIGIAKQTRGKPSMIVLDTQKGKGCSFAEGVLDNHHMSASPEQTAAAVAKLEALLNEKGRG